MLVKPLIRVFFLGNAIQEWLMPSLNLSPVTHHDSNGILVVHNEDEITNEQDGFHVVQRACVPQHTQLLILPDAANDVELNPSANDSIFIVDSWTFRNNKSIQMAESYRNKFPYTDVRIALLQTNRKTSSTDLSDVQTALNHAVCEYEQEGFPVTLIKNDDINPLFIWKKRAYHDMLKRDFKTKLGSAKRFMEQDYDFHYHLLKTSLEDHWLNPTSLEAYTRYDGCIGIAHMNNVIEIAIKSFFEKSPLFLEELEDLYHAFTRGITILDERRILDGLVGTLTARFYYDMSRALPVIDVNHQWDELSYHKFIFQSKFNAIFVQQCTQFFNHTAKEVTKNYFDGILVKMEELL